MKHLKKFEFFFQGEKEENPFDGDSMPGDKQEITRLEDEDECEPCSDSEKEDEDDKEEEKNWGDETIKVEGFKSFNEKKALTKKQKDVLDKNKNGIIDEEDFKILRKEKEGKGLTAAQKKLPEALKASILKKKGKK